MLHQHPQQNHTEQALDLDGLGLENLAEGSLRGNSLLKISLYDNRLRQFPMQILQHTDLQVLNISCNQLGELPVEIGQLQGLAMLDCGHNKANSVPASIGELRELTYLYLSDNAFCDLPVELGRLHKLRYLNVTDNQLRENCQRPLFNSVPCRNCGCTIINLSVCQPLSGN